MQDVRSKDLSMAGGPRPVMPIRPFEAPDISASPLPVGWTPSLCWEHRAHRAAKRALDLTLAAAMPLLLLPLLLVVALLVRCSSPGPVLFRQLRVGKNGQTFSLYKFRTMFVDSDPAIHEAYYRRLVDGDAKPVAGAFKLVDDPRITPVGRLLRRLSLDEIPQLLNVLRGDMSLVGPRPPLPYEVAMYDGRARLRLSVTPGITGLWQVSGRNQLDFHQMVDLDLAYIARWSFWLDLWILLRTPPVLITAKGAH